MTLRDIAHLRLANQNIISEHYDNPKQLVSWMGAMQAQDFPMVKWAIGLRVPGSTIRTVNKAIDEGEIIRTHLLRPTWHIVSADDLRWILNLTAGKIREGLNYRHDNLGLSPQILTRTNEIISGILRGKHLAREDISGELSKGGIDTDTGDNRVSHLLLWAELNGIICSGKTRGNTQTYSLIEERVPPGTLLQKEEMLRILAMKYFSSHGPATIKDFAWWSGLTTKEIRTALELAGDELESHVVDSVTCWQGKDRKSIPEDNRAILLPSYDELIIGYSDRSAVLSEPDHKKIISSNGVFRPVIVMDNRVAGLWRTVRVKEKVAVELSLFKPAKKSQKRALEAAAQDYGNFLEKKIEIKYT